MLCPPWVQSLAGLGSRRLSGCMSCHYYCCFPCPVHSRPTGQYESGHARTGCHRSTPGSLRWRVASIRSCCLYFVHWGCMQAACTSSFLRFCLGQPAWLCVAFTVRFPPSLLLLYCCCASRSYYARRLAATQCRQGNQEMRWICGGSVTISHSQIGPLKRVNFGDAQESPSLFPDCRFVVAG